MPPLSQLLAFTLTAVVIVAIPGPSVLFTISRALTAGRRTALLTVLGNAVGIYLQAIAVAVGMGALIEQSVVAFTVVKYLGAAYVVYLGVQAIRHRHAMSQAIAQAAAPVRSTRAVWDGGIVGLTNPKTIVVLATVMPGYVEPATGGLTSQLLLLGLAFPLAGLVLDSIWAMLAGSARTWLVRSPRRQALLGGTGGMVMIGFGLSIALTGRKD